MNCKLCLHAKELRRSHIIPEFHYKPLYDQKHRFIVLSSNSKEQNRWTQKGLRELLLCDSCEQLFSQWEDYAYSVLFDDKAKVLLKHAKKTRVGGIDYKRFKLFLMSVLWRMSIAEGEFWKQVKLPLAVEENLRTCLLHSDPLSANDYACVMTAILLDGEFNLGWFLPSDLIRMEHQKVCTVVINSVLFTYFVVGHSLSVDLAQVAITQQGEMTVLVEEARSIPIVSEAIMEIGRANRARARARPHK